MPCYRCGARQTDPARGASPWKRGVRDDSQVLICPECQRSHDWTAELDSCPECDSTMLVRALGATTCRACGWSVERQGPHPQGADANGDTALADDVQTALARLWERERRDSLG